MCCQVGSISKYKRRLLLAGLDKVGASRRMSMKPIPRIILAAALAIGAAILIWHYRPAKPPAPRMDTNVEPSGVIVERAAADPADTSTRDVVWVNYSSAGSTNLAALAAPVIDHAHFPFTDIADPWQDMDPTEVSQEEHKRWLNDKREFVLREAKEDFAARQALWEQFKAERR